MMMTTAMRVLCLLGLLVATISGHGDHPEKPMDHAMRQRSLTFRKQCRATASCVLQNEVTEGPYYYDTELVRQDITEGYDGISVDINFKVIDTATCEPIANAAVDLWHANAMGVYSHYQNSANNGGAETTFCRGIQLTDSTGAATIKTILAGWYAGRCVHYHVKVHIGGNSTTTLFTGGNVVHTGQLFFNQSFIDSYKVVSPYTSDTQSLTQLSADSIYQEATDIAIMEVQYKDSAAGFSGGLVATITLGVDSTSTTSSGGSASPSSGGTPPGSSSSSSSTSTTSSSTAGTAEASFAHPVDLSFSLTLLILCIAFVIVM